MAKASLKIGDGLSVGFDIGESCVFAFHTDGIAILTKNEAQRLANFLTRMMEQTPKCRSVKRA